MRDTCTAVLASVDGSRTLAVVARLEVAVSRGKPVPIVKRVSVDKDEIYDCLDLIRRSPPRSLTQRKAVPRSRFRAIFPSDPYANMCS